MEEVFLAFPDQVISRWWIVLVNRYTVGPFPFPAGIALGVMSGASRQLA